MKNKKKLIAIIILIILIVCTVSLSCLVYYYKAIKKDNHINNPTETEVNKKRLTALLTLSKNVATWYQKEEKRDYEEIGVKDNLTKKYGLGSGNWQCLNKLVIGEEESIFLKNKLKGNDIVSSGIPPVGGVDSALINKNTCSSAFYDEEEGIVILLIANKTGNYNVSNNTITFALSNQTKGQKGAILE